MLKTAISEVFEDASGRMMARMNNDGSFFIADFEQIPEAVKLSATEDRTPLQFKYHPDDQFCYYVDPDEVATLIAAFDHVMSK
jgi:hypothetical protein